MHENLGKKNYNLFSFRISNWQPSLPFFFRIIRKDNIVFGRVEYDMQIIYYIWCNRPEKSLQTIQKVARNILNGDIAANNFVKT